MCFIYLRVFVHCIISPKTFPSFLSSTSCSVIWSESKLKSKVLCTSLTINIKTPFRDRCFFVQHATISRFCSTVMFNATFRHQWLTLILISTGYEYEVNNDISPERSVVIINVPIILGLSLMCCIVKICQALMLNSAGITGSSMLPVLSSKGQYPQSMAWRCLPRFMITGQIADVYNISL